MSPMDWDVMVADLEEKRTAAAQEVSDIDAVLEAVRRRANGTATPAPKAKAAPAHKNGRAKAKATTNGKRDGRSTLTDAQLKTMREQFERGDAADAIGKRAGVTDSAVYLRAKAGGWKRPAKAKTARPNPGVAASPAAAAPAQHPAGHQLSGQVKCSNPDCEAWTDYDPCRKCGKPLKRKW